MTLFTAQTTNSSRHHFWFLSNVKRKSRNLQKKNSEKGLSEKEKGAQQINDVAIEPKVDARFTRSKKGVQQINEVAIEPNVDVRFTRSNSFIVSVKNPNGNDKDGSISSSRRSLVLACGLGSTGSISSSGSVFYTIDDHPAKGKPSSIEALTKQSCPNSNGRKFPFLSRTSSVSHQKEVPSDRHLKLSNRNSLDLTGTTNRRSRARKVGKKF